MNQKEVWAEVRDQLRNYVLLRNWNVDFIVTHLNLKPVAGRKSVFLWLGDFNRPAGNHLVALWYLLHEFGVSAPGIRRLDSDVQFAGLLFTFGVDSLENICLRAFGLHGTPQEFYRILRGDQTPRQVTELRATYKDELRRCINQAIELEQQVVESAESIRTLVAARR